MIIDPRIFVAVGDVFLNLSAGWFGAAVIIPNVHTRSTKHNISFVVINIALGFMALVFGYQFRILGI